MHHPTMKSSYTDGGNAVHIQIQGRDNECFEDEVRLFLRVSVHVTEGPSCHGERNVW